ncbi:amidohydrolase family protein [Streptomyces sp. NPDC017095]|uniref:amidohydrolase family protein n=1 Tax=Streptomyces sp. NPDC017095 TaxID=3364977 RepID=UPI0037A1596B
MRPAARTRATWTGPPPAHPVCLTDFSGHMVWATSRALEVAGITRGTGSPAGGVIETDATGEPTGVLKETAQALVQGLIPPATVPERKEVIRMAVAALHAEGTTSYTEPGLGPGGTEILGGGLYTATLQAYTELARGPTGVSGRGVAAARAHGRLGCRGDGRPGRARGT